MAATSMQAVAARAAKLVSVDGKSYPLEAARIAGRAEGGLALTRLVQRFKNPHDEALEVVYTMPLPADGAVLGYVVRVGEKVIRGEIEPREQAEADYRKALYEGRTAGLLEQERADTFTQRLGNVPARTGVEVTIEVLHPLAFLVGLDGASPQWEYRFPTVVGVRYEGGPGRVGDAAKLDVDRDPDGAIPTRVELDLLIADALAPDAGPVSPSHGVVREQGLEGTLVRFAEGQRLDRDVVLRWNACTGEVGVRLVEGRGLEGDDGRYALLTIVPPAAPQAAFPRDLTVLLDASGSMSGMPLELAKQVVGELLRSLETGDRFELLAFANDVEGLTDGLVGFDEASLAAALKALERLQAGGGTEMAHAVTEALQSLREDSQRQVVLVTDGYIGFEGEVIGRIAKAPVRGVRMHAVGIGAAPNRTLLAGVARAGRGVELLVGDEATATTAAMRLCAATARPVLTDLVVGGTAVAHVASGAVRDVFAGQPLVFPVELRKEGGAVLVTGRLAGSAEEWKAKLDVPAPGAQGGPRATPLPIGALHGREVIADLEVELSTGRDAAGADRRIEKCAMRHRIVSRRTSLVAIAEEPSVDPKQPRRRERLAVELPAGVSAEGAGLVMGGMRMASIEACMPCAPSSVRMRWSKGPGKAKPERALPRPTQRSPEEIHLAGANVVREPDGTLVVEFEVPYDGFVLPDEAVYAVVGGKFFDKARVVRDLSSPPGPHARGMIVRLALRLTTESEWPRVSGLGLRWSGERALPDGAPAPVRLVLDATPPEEKGTPRP